MPARKPVTDTAKLQRRLLVDLNDLLVALQREGNMAGEAVVLDFIDRVTGTHSGGARLFPIHICANCGQSFVPKSSNTSRYCYRPAPQSKTGRTTCQEMGKVIDYRARKRALSSP